jgi:hypothetical protein
MPNTNPATKVLLISDREFVFCLFFLGVFLSSIGMMLERLITNP